MTPFASKATHFVVTRTSVLHPQSELDEAEIRKESFVFEADATLKEVFERVIPLEDARLIFFNTRKQSQYSIEILPDENSVDFSLHEANSHEEMCAELSNDHIPG